MSKLVFNRFMVINVKRRVMDVYMQGKSEDAYLAYRNITGAGIPESWHVVKPWIKAWGGKKQ